jgi:hypothetical protein
MNHTPKLLLAPNFGGLVVYLQRKLLVKCITVRKIPTVTFNIQRLSCRMDDVRVTLPTLFRQYNYHLR